MKWFQTPPMTASALTLTKCATGFLSEPNKVKIKVLFTQEFMGDSTWPGHGSAPSVHNVTHRRTLPAERSGHRRISPPQWASQDRVLCTATSTFATPQSVHRTIPQQVKNPVRLTGWGVFCLLFFFFSCCLKLLDGKDSKLYSCTSVSVWIHLSFSVAVYWSQCIYFFPSYFLHQYFCFFFFF